MAYAQPYQAPVVQPVAQPVIVPYQGPGVAMGGPPCTVCRQACVGSYFKCQHCGQHHRDYFLCATCHSRIPPKKTGGLFNIKGIVNGINRDLAAVSHALEGSSSHESWHDFHRVDPVVYAQPAHQNFSSLPQGHGYGNPNAPPMGYAPNPGYGNPNYAMSPQYGGPQAYSTMSAPPPNYATPSAPPAETNSAYEPPPQAYSPQPGYAPPQQGYAPVGYAGPPEAQQGYPAAALPVYVPPGPYSPPPMAQTVAPAAQPLNHIQLTLSCKQLPIAQLTGERPSPNITVSAGDRELGRTELIYGCQDPFFKTTVIIRKDESKLTFLVQDGSKRLGTVKDVLLKDILASPEWSGRLTDVKTGYRLPTGSVFVHWAPVA